MSLGWWDSRCPATACLGTQSTRPPEWSPTAKVSIHLYVNICVDKHRCKYSDMKSYFLKRDKRHSKENVFVIQMGMLEVVLWKRALHI